MCYSKLILNCDGSRHLSEAVKVPMNHTTLTPFSLCVDLTRPLSPFGMQPVCVTLSLSLFVSLPSHVPVSEHYQRHGMCWREMKCICHCFPIYTLILPHAVLSLAVSLRLSRFLCLVLPYCWVSSLQLMCSRTNKHFIGSIVRNIVLSSQSCTISIIKNMKFTCMMVKVKLHTQHTLGGQVWGHSRAFLKASHLYKQISADNIEMTSLCKACVCVLTCKEGKNRAKIAAPEASSEQC